MLFFSTPLPAFVISSLCRWPFYRWCGFNLHFPNDSGGASLVAQMVKCQPTMRETWVWSLGQEDPLEKEMATHSSRKIQSHGLRSLVGYSPWGRKESDTTEQLHFHFNDSGGWTSFHVPVGHSPISFGKISMWVLCPFLHWKTCFCFTVVATELYEFLTHFDELIPYQIDTLQILFPVLFCVFSFCCFFLLCRSF